MLFFVHDYIAERDSPFSTKNVYDTIYPDRKATILLELLNLTMI